MKLSHTNGHLCVNSPGGDTRIPTTHESIPDEIYQRACHAFNEILEEVEKNDPDGLGKSMDQPGGA